MTLTKLKLAFGAIVIAGATAALVVQHQAQARLHDQNESLQQQLAQLQTDNDTLSNQLAAADSSRSSSQQQFNELLKLRSEVGLLHRQTAELDRLRADNQRLQLALQNVPAAAPPAGLETEQQQRAIRKMTDAKQGVLGIIMFAQNNQQQCPTNFEQMAPYLTDPEALTSLASNYDFTYQGSMADITNSASTIVLKEKQAWQTAEGGWRKAYGFADGHAEIHGAPDGNFADWENQRMIPPAPGP